MRLYFKFLFTLACGLLGVGFVLKTLLDTLFNEWDAFNDAQRRFQAYISGKRHVELIRPEDVVLEPVEAGRAQTQSSDTLASIIPS